VALPSGDEIVLLHNPRCSKSRAALELLEERGVPFTERRYLDQPLDVAELAELGERLASPPAEWVRKGEAAYGEAGLSGEATDDALLQAMAERPILMERPILVRGDRAVVGRPPERILELL
jgi:arsenate reductase